MTEEVGKKVCEGTVADLMKDKTGKPQRVKPTRGEALTGLEGGWKHPLTIRMRGLPLPSILMKS